MKLGKINNISASSWRKEYSMIDVINFYDNINIETNPLKLNEKVYFMCKSISQSKVRDIGFQIVREKSKADIIILDNWKTLGGESSYDNKNIIFNYGRTDNFENFMDIMITEQHLNYKYVVLEDFYKYLYKYDGNLELFTNCCELFGSDNRDNIKIAMEFISNANWEVNKIYLVELFGRFFYNMNIPYKNSISFQGFLKSLDFNPNSCKIYDAVGYQKYCKTEEHHQWVWGKFKDEFEDDLKNLFRKHKVKLNNINYEINKGIIKNNEDDE